MTDKQIKNQEEAIKMIKKLNEKLKNVDDYVVELRSNFYRIKQDLDRKEQECEELKEELESTKGLVTVGNKQLSEALLELQKYEDKEQKEKEENEKLYKKLEGSCLIGKHWRFK